MQVDAVAIGMREIDDYVRVAYPAVRRADEPERIAVAVGAEEVAGAALENPVPPRR